MTNHNILAPEEERLKRRLRGLTITLCQLRIDAKAAGFDEDEFDPELKRIRQRIDEKWAER